MIFWVWGRAIIRPRTENTTRTVNESDHAGHGFFSGSGGCVGGVAFCEAPGGKNVQGGHGYVGNDEFYAERGEVGEEEVTAVLAQEVLFGD